MNFLAQLISFVFHPLLMPSYAFFLIDRGYPLLLASFTPQAKLNLFISIFLNTFIYPVIVIALMRKLDFIKTIYLRTKQERIIPYIAINIFYFWTYTIIRWKVAPGEYRLPQQHAHLFWKKY